MPKVNLLEKFQDERIKIIGAEDLMLDRIPRLVYPDPADAEKCEYALGVLRAPLQNIDNIVYRRDVARDFLASDDLLDRLTAVAAGADGFRQEWQEKRKALIAAHVSGEDNDPALEGKFRMLKLNLASFLELSDRLGSLIDILASGALYAEGLLEFKETCIRLFASHAFSDVPRAKKLLAADPGNFTAELLLGINENLSVETVELNTLYTQREKSDGAHEAGKKNRNYVSVKTVELVPMLVSALDTLNNQTVESCEELLKLFRELEQELRFYRFCIDLCGAFRRAGGTYIFPQVTEPESAVTSILDLRDPYEVLSAGKAVPHDILLTPERSGIVVTGEGGVGKTALLRAVCVSQILGQCGLPIICRDASLSIRSGIFVCFTDVSDPDRDPLRRFESEAQSMAKIIDSIAPYSLVALNELFETVSFADASDALYNIFSVMTQSDISFLATTHLPRLAERFIEVDRITAMSMNSESKLEVMTNA